MRILRILVHRWRSLFQRSQAETDLQREIDIHIEQLTKELMASGMTEAEATLAARREFGPVGVTKEHCRDMRRIHFVDELIRDLVYAFRALKKSPVFTAMALVSLALGIGANTAIYSFMDAFLLRALPIPHPENLVVVNWRAKGWPKVAYSQHGDDYKDPGGITVSGTFPYPAWESLRENNESLTALFAFASAGRLNLVVGNQAFLGDGEYVSGDYFSAIGAPPAAGRLMDNNDDHISATPVAVISYRFWQGHLGGMANAIGQMILVNRHPFVIAGVTAPEFYGVNPQSAPDIFLPLHSLAYVDARVQNRDWFQERNNYWLEMMGRLRPGVRLRQAEVSMAARFHSFVISTAANDKERSNLPALWLEEGGSGIDALRRKFSEPLYVLIGMTGLILAIAAANIANLLLSRAAARRREIAVRLSLGANRWRIIRQLLTESVLMAGLGGLLGLAVAALGIRFLTWLLANGQQDFTLRATIDVRILLFAIFVSVVTGIVFGLAPALQATRVDVAPALKESPATATRVHRFGLPFGLSHILTAGQIALSLLLVIAAGLFVTTLSKLHSVSMGFNAEKVLLFNLNAGQAGYDEARATRFYESMRQRFANMPGVRAATVSDMPLVANLTSANSILVAGFSTLPGKRPSTRVMLVGPFFFSTMQIPVLLGRPIDEQDTANAAHVVVVNQAFAKKFFPEHSAIGQHFAFDGPKPRDVQIVGVARNSLYASLKEEISPVAYISWAQPPPGWLIGGMYYEIRTLGNPLALANSVRQIVHQADPRLPVANLTTQMRTIDSTIAPERTFANLCTCFGFLALLIACVGLYGTMAYAVARRTNEIGIRVALGAQRQRVIWMVQREVLVLSFIGVAIGLGAAWESAHWVASFLFGVRPDDVGIFGLSTVVLMMCSLAAAYVPARRASHIDPMQALRHE